jgi:SAM-dependent methyltransferase
MYTSTNATLPDGGKTAADPTEPGGWGVALARRALTLIRSHPTAKERAGKMLRAVGYDTTDWMRVVMYRECFAFIESLGPERLDVLEISGGPQWRRRFAFRSYTATEYPGYDICAEQLPQRFDLIIADQVFEHLPWPYRAGRNALGMLKHGGHLIVTVPFLVRVHPSPIDCCRWTETGLSYLLQECGFAEAGIRTGSWGNRACAKGNFSNWRKRGFFGSLANEPHFPVTVWAFAQSLEHPERPPVAGSKAVPQQQDTRLLSPSAQIAPHDVP